VETPKENRAWQEMDKSPKGHLVRLNPDDKRYKDKAGFAKRKIRVPVHPGRGKLA